MLAIIITQTGYDGIDELIGFASMLNANDLRIFSLPDYKDFTTETYLNLLPGHLKELSPDAIIMPELPALSGIAPALAVRLDMQCITSVQEMDKKDGTLKLIRSVLGGKAVMEIVPVYPVVISLLPGTFEKPGITRSSNISVTELTISPPPLSAEWVEQSSRIRNLGIIESEKQQSGLPVTEAEVLVAAGRGIGKPENLELIRKLAGHFSRSTVSGSRAVVDSGWLPYSAQVGLTGKTVTPKLYIACGISGSPQHIAGMKNSKLIVAINKDPNAAIFNYSHYCIAHDLFEFIPALIEELEKHVKN
jgi:electron transfer flavoprotein alpha subunit